MLQDVLRGRRWERQPVVVVMMMKMRINCIHPPLLVSVYGLVMLSHPTNLTKQPIYHLYHHYSYFITTFVDKLPYIGTNKDVIEQKAIPQTFCCPLSYLLYLHLNSICIMKVLVLKWWTTLYNWNTSDCANRLSVWPWAHSLSHPCFSVSVALAGRQ